MAKQTLQVGTAVGGVARFASLATPVANWNPFPAIDSEMEPTGSDVLVQLRTARRTTAGGIILSAESVETDYWNIQTAIVRAIGPLAYMNRDTMTAWPEGAWCKVGDFIRVPRYGGDRWEIQYGDADETALFALFRDTEIRARVTGDPLKIKAYVK